MRFPRMLDTVSAGGVFTIADEIMLGMYRWSWVGSILFPPFPGPEIVACGCELDTVFELAVW